MARKYNTEVREKKAVEFVLTIEDFEKYKTAWLAICNNLRAEKEIVWKVFNNSGDDIYVIANAEHRDDVKKWLSKFGPITVENDITAVFVDVWCDYGNFDKDYIYSEYVLGDVD